MTLASNLDFDRQETVEFGKRLIIPPKITERVRTQILDRERIWMAGAIDFRINLSEVLDLSEYVAIASKFIEHRCAQISDNVSG
jgi:hypothetical protein